MAVGGFRKAKAQQAALKMGIYGTAGSGKTFTALLIAEGLAKRDKKRVAFVDTEHGTDFYATHVPARKIHPEPFDFDSIYTRSIHETLTECLKINPQTHSCVVIDSITHIWEACRQAYDGKINKAGMPPFHAWRKIKEPWRKLLAHLLNSPMHFIFCGREGKIWEHDEKDDELRAVGTKMKAEGETPYEPHILIRMEASHPKPGEDGKWFAYAEKDRTGVLAGRLIVNPDFSTIAEPILGLLGGQQAQMANEDDVGKQDAEAFGEADAARDAEADKTFRYYSAAMDMAADQAALEAVSKALTPDVKRKMTAEQTTELREKYRILSQKLPAALTRQLQDSVAATTPITVTAPGELRVVMAKINDSNDPAGDEIARKRAEILGKIAAMDGFQLADFRSKAGIWEPAEVNGIDDPARLSDMLLAAAGILGKARTGKLKEARQPT